MKVLVLNSGSSSQKSVLFDLASDEKEYPRPLWQGKIEWDGEIAKLDVRTASGATQNEETQARNRGGAVAGLLESLCKGSTAVLNSPSEVNVVGHRVVHGGPKLFEPVLITREIKSEIARIEPFAPLHNRAELQGIDFVEQWAGAVPQVAVFDTGFHRTMPRSAALYPGPYEWVEQGIVRYGFHGINHEYCSQRVGQLLGGTPRNLISCHLGNGCSLAAIQNGKSIDTTMGFTPLDGLMMGTRSGSLDPGILTYLMRTTRATGDELDRTLNQRSGLLGISGLSSDMRQVRAAAEQGNDRAQLAFDMFVHRLHRGIGAMAAVLGGVEVLVFTGGIGENSAEVRSSTCAKLGFLGAELDLHKNAACRPDQEISRSTSSVKVFVLSAQEDWAIAKACVHLLRANADDRSNGA
jgi:acetate kinase